MNPVAESAISNVIGAEHQLPSVSIIMPFEPKMNLKSGLAYTLEKAVDKVEGKLLTRVC